MPRRFANSDPRHRPPGFGAVLRWGLFDRLIGRRRIASPGEPAPRVAPDLPLIHADAQAGDRLTWIGHSSFLLAVDGLRLLCDPVFSSRIGAFHPRHGAPGLLPEQLPRIDAVLVSHNHYDHLDARSIAALPVDVAAIVPLGLGRWFRERRSAPVVELGWWDALDLGGTRITCVPARHWSRRRMFDRNRSLWGGFVVEGTRTSVYFAGDTAWFDGFGEVRRRFPDLDAALLPIGGYAPAWFMDRNHLDPEQAGRAFLATGARRLIPMHWGTFQMTDEPLAEPASRLRAWWREHDPRDGRQLLVPAVGETLRL